ncbi:MAG TPA: methyltransferase [Nitrospira sp.]|nr:methyltransferase [Nitrospira sp.]
MHRPPLIDPAARPEPIPDYTALAKLADEFLSQEKVGKGSAHVQHIRACILQHGDPLGETYARLVSPDVRRQYGATFTPPAIVRAMLAWAKSQHRQFVRVIDPGAGSGRFALAAARAFPKAEIIAVEKEPHIAHLLKATVIAAGLAHQIRVVVQDYRSLELPNVTGATLFVGNPPYVRHHAIEAQWKRWYTAALKAYDLSGSQLAGLHLHFLLKTRQLARPGDCGCFITAAEWLDVNYGSSFRTMFTNGMGGQALHLIDKTVPVFDDALTSAVILCFQVGAMENAMRMRHVTSIKELADLRGGRRISRSRARASDKWSQLGLGTVYEKANTIELGDLFDVHRGQVTGMNAVWISGERAQQLPCQLRVPTVTAAKELINAPDHRLDSSAGLKSVVSLPADLNELDASTLERVQDFLSWAKSQGAHRSYIAQHRRPWWRVNMPAPAPILMTYMARRPPAFVRNLCGARIVNIAHGLYPRVPLTDEDLDRVTDWLNANVRISSGRTYAGGLTKFEPREVMRLRIPPLELIRQR